MLLFQTHLQQARLLKRVVSVPPEICAPPPPPLPPIQNLNNTAEDQSVLATASMQQSINKSTKTVNGTNSIQRNNRNNDSDNTSGDDSSSNDCILKPSELLKGRHKTMAVIGKLFSISFYLKLLNVTFRVMRIWRKFPMESLDSLNGFKLEKKIVFSFHHKFCRSFFGPITPRFEDMCNRSVSMILMETLRTQTCGH